MDGIRGILSFLPLRDIISLSICCRDLSTRVTVERVKEIKAPYRYPLLLIDQLPHFKRLRTLDLKGANLGPIGAARLAERLVGLHHLKDVRLGGNYVGVEGIRVLSAAFLSRDNRAELKYLDLSDNDIGRDGAQFIAIAFHHGAALQSLDTLDLSGNNIGLKGAGLLFTAFAALGE